MSTQPPIQPYEPGSGEEGSNLPPTGPTNPTPPQARNQTKDAWIWGVVLIALGGLFLLQNFTSFHLENWWAIFILIPAAGSFINVWREYQESGLLTGRTQKSLFSGLIFATVAAIFLFNLSFGLLWPVLLIGAGLAVVINALVGD